MEITDDIAKGYSGFLKEKLSDKDLRQVRLLFKFLKELAIDSEEKIEVGEFEKELLSQLAEMRDNFNYNVERIFKIMEKKGKRNVKTPKRPSKN